MERGNDGSSIRENGSQKRSLGICKGFRKLVGRLQRRVAVSCLNGSGENLTRKLMHTNDTIPVYTQRNHSAEKWDWDYYDQEQYSMFDWPIEHFGQHPYLPMLHQGKRYPPEKLALNKLCSHNFPSAVNLRTYPGGDYLCRRVYGVPSPRESETVGSRGRGGRIRHVRHYGINVSSGDRGRSVGEILKSPKTIPKNSATAQKKNIGKNQKPGLTPLARSRLSKERNFKLPKKNPNWCAIKLRHERAKVNLDRIVEDKNEEKRHKNRVWELRLKVGLCMRNLQQQNKVASTKLSSDLEKYYHLVYWIGHGQNINNIVGRFVDLESSRVVVLKIFNHKSPTEDLKRLENKLLAMTEVKCLLEIDHPNVIRLLTYFELSEKMHLVLEPCDHTLRAEIEAAKNGMPEPKAQSIIFQVLSGLNHCHSRKLLHRDISPENILITSDGVVKIADFDKAILLDEVRLTLPPGTVMYGAPEMLSRDRDDYGLPTDVWSLGVILCEMLLGTPVWNGDTDREQLDKIQRDMGFLYPRYSTHTKTKLKEKPFLQRKFAHCSEATICFLLQCLMMDPSNRSTCSMLMGHLFFTDETESFEKLPLRLHQSGDAPGIESASSHQINKRRGSDQMLLSEVEDNCGVYRKLIYKTDSEKVMKNQRLTPRKTRKSENPEFEADSNFEQSLSQKQSSMNCRLDTRASTSCVRRVRAPEDVLVKRKNAQKGDSQLSINNYPCSAEDAENEDSFAKVAMPEIRRRTSNSTLNLGMQSLINALGSVNWNSVAIFKYQFELIKKSDPVSFRQNIKTFISCLMKQITSTKTTIAGPALKILSTLLKDHGEYFQTETDSLLCTLLQKIGGPYFIEIECCEALHNLIVIAPPVQVCLALAVKSETKLKNANTRYVASFYLHEAMKNLNMEMDIGEETVAQKKLTKAVFKTTLWFMQDPDPKTRQGAKNILELLMTHSRFWDFYRHYVPDSNADIIQRALKEIRCSKNSSTTN